MDAAGSIQSRRGRQRHAAYMAKSLTLGPGLARTMGSSADRSAASISTFSASTHFAMATAESPAAATPPVLSLGIEVGRYISIERLIEENKERYYETLEQSSQGWHEGKHDPWPT